MFAHRLKNCSLALAISCGLASASVAADPPKGDPTVTGPVADGGVSSPVEAAAPIVSRQDAMAARKQEWLRKRREILRHSSDQGIGASLGQYRSQKTVIGRDVTADAIARLQESQDAVSSLLQSQSLYQYGDLYGYRLYGRSPLYDWHPPVVQQIGRRWVIRPGHFHDHRSHAGRYYQGGQSYSSGSSYGLGTPYSYGSPPLWQP